MTFKKFILSALLPFWLCLGAFAQSGKPIYKTNPQHLEERDVTTLEIGKTAPDFRLPGTDGKWYTLSSFKKADILVVIFTANHCPTAQCYEDKINKLVSDYNVKKVSFVAISSNSPLGLLDNEIRWSDLGDTYEDMIIRVKEKHYNFPYLYDGDKEEVALLYGPVATPHAFIFDKNRKLVYTGRLDKFPTSPDKGDCEDVRSAIDATLNGKPVTEPITKTFGCSTKWAWKFENREKERLKFESMPVTLNPITADSAALLVKNVNGKKLRLINVWATWCGPCVEEYPDLVHIYRIYEKRNFETFSINTDKFSNKDNVLSFLKENFSTFTNFIYNGDDVYKLIEAIDPKWNGAIPYTLLVEPGGKIIYSHQGSLEPYPLQRAIVDHHLLTRIQ